MGFCIFVLVALSLVTKNQEYMSDMHLAFFILGTHMTGQCAAVALFSDTCSICIFETTSKLASKLVHLPIKWVKIVSTKLIKGTNFAIWNFFHCCLCDKGQQLYVCVLFLKFVDFTELQ